MNLFQEAGFLLKANEILRLNSDEMMAWAESRIRKLDRPPIWLIEFYPVQSSVAEDFLAIVPKGAKGYRPTAKQLIAYVVEAFVLERLSFKESLPALFQIWIGASWDFQPLEFPEDLVELLSEWDQLEDLDQIPGGLSSRIKYSFQHYRFSDESGKLGSIEDLLWEEDPG